MQNKMDSVHIQRWSSEIPLLITVSIVSIIIWILIISTIVGILYAFFIGLFFFLTHVAAVAHVRGNAVKITPEQFPDIYARVEKLARQFGLERIPEVYEMQNDGILNAFAAKFMRARMIVIYSHMVDACNNNPAILDMIIAHEIGHIKAGHLKWHALLAPGMFFPFLGKALSRAREYTCDRYALAGAGSKEAALQGLMILAAGEKRAAKVSPQTFVNQAINLNTGWMKIGEWLMRHPLLVRRMYEINPSLKPSGSLNAQGRTRGIFILIGLFAFSVLLVGTWTYHIAIQDKTAQQQQQPTQYFESLNTT